MSLLAKTSLLQVGHTFLNSPVMVSRLLTAVFEGPDPKLILK